MHKMAGIYEMGENARSRFERIMTCEDMASVKGYDSKMNTGKASSRRHQRMARMLGNAANAYLGYSRMLAEIAAIAANPAIFNVS